MSPSSPLSIRPAMSSPARARLWALLVCQCVLTAGLALSYPFFALYLHRVRGLPMGWVGAALSLMLAGTAVGQVLAGELADILGSKQVMEASVASRAMMVVAAMGLAIVHCAMSGSVFPDQRAGARRTVLRKHFVAQ